MQTVNVRQQQRWREHEHQEVAKDEVRTPERQLDDLHNEFTGGLRQGVVTEATAIPLTGPPGAVRLVVLELTGEEDGN